VYNVHVFAAFGLLALMITMMMMMMMKMVQSDGTRALKIRDIFGNFGSTGSYELMPCMHPERPVILTLSVHSGITIEYVTVDQGKYEIQAVCWTYSFTDFEPN